MRILVLALLAAAVAADAPAKQDKRKLARWADVSTTWEALELDDGVALAEGHRGMRDVFPYWVAARGATAATREAHAVTPRNIAHFLKKTDGKVIVNERQALELVRTFVAGPLITTKKDAARVIDAARALEGVESKVTEHRPPSYAPTATLTEGRWTVSLVALEIVGRLQFVHVTAAVDRAGQLAIKRTPIVDGPQLSWQTGYRGEPSDADLARERAERAKVHGAMLRCLEAAQLEINAENAWVVSRTLDRFSDVRRVFGEPVREWGKTAKFLEYRSTAGTKITFASGRDKNDTIEGVVELETVERFGVRATVPRMFRQ